MQAKGTADGAARTSLERTSIIGRVSPHPRNNGCDQSASEQIPGTSNVLASKGKSKSGAVSLCDVPTP